MNAPRPEEGRLRILAIAQDFSRRNPSGSALLRLLNPMAERHDITCLGGSRPEEMDLRIKHVAVQRLSRGGLLLAFLAFHVRHVLAWRRLIRKADRPFDIVQTIDAESFLGTVVTFHFCDAAYLQVAGQHGLLRGNDFPGWMAAIQSRLMYWIRALISRRVCRACRTRAIICLSEGQAEEVRRFYLPRAPISVIPNAAP